MKPIIFLLVLIIFTSLGFYPIVVHAPTSPVTWRTVNYDRNFNNTELQWGNHLGTKPYSPDNYSYWRNAVNGNNTGCGQEYGSAQIPPPVQTEDGNWIGEADQVLNSTSTTPNQCYDSASTDQGNFPWQTAGRGCGTAVQQWKPIFTCPYNSYGLREVPHSDFKTNMTVEMAWLGDGALHNPVVTCTVNNCARYNLFVDLYWWFDRGNVTVNSTICSNHVSCTHAWLETMVKYSAKTWTGSAWANQTDPSGYRLTDIAQDFEYSIIHWNFPDQQHGIGNFDSTYNVTQLYKDATTAWGIPSSTHAVLLGISLGLEGYGTKISATFTQLNMGTYMPDIAAADTNFDHTINAPDQGYIAFYWQLCPANHGGPKSYSWIADAYSESQPDPSNPPRYSSGNACINISDVSLMALYYGSSY